MSNLFHWQITSLATCELCKACPEDSLHTLWLCKEVESAWSLFISFHQANFPPPTNSYELTNRFLQVKDDYRKEIFVISAWLLWSWRNVVHFGKLVQSIANISALVGNLLWDFLAAQDVEPKSLCHLMWNIGILQIKILTSLTLMQLSSKLLIQLELGL